MTTISPMVNRSIQSFSECRNGARNSVNACQARNICCPRIFWYRHQIPKWVHDFANDSSPVSKNKKLSLSQVVNCYFGAIFLVMTSVYFFQCICSTKSLSVHPWDPHLHSDGLAQMARSASIYSFFFCKWKSGGNNREQILTVQIISLQLFYAILHLFR